ncbi:MAG: hypothetical protein AAB337_02445 [Patescibacteria group bacterium]
MRKKNIKNAPSIEDDLKIIYGNNTNKKREAVFSSLDHRARRKNSFTRLLVWTLGILLVLAGLTFGGYVIFGNPFKATEAEAIELSIEGPDEVKSGQSVRYEIRYANVGRMPVAALELQLIAPQGLQISSTEPTPTNEDDEWTIGSVSPGSDGVVVIDGIWIDPVPSAQTIQVISSYRPSNFNADFQDIATKSVSIKDATLAIETEGVTTATAGEMVSYLFRVKNEGEIPASYVRLRLTVPESFAISSANPLPPDSGAEWIIETLEPGGTFEVTIEGSFSSDAVGLQEISAHVGLMRDISFLEQATVVAQTDVEEAEIKITLITNGSTTDQTIDFGDTLRVSISVQTDNPTETTIELVFNPDREIPIDWANADLDDGKQTDGTITWEGVTDVDLALPINAGGNFTMTAQASVGSLTIRSSPMSVAVNSNLWLFAQAHYYIDDTPVGLGPLPPQVGEKTTYRVVWEVQNSGHPIKDIIVKATVPINAKFEVVRETSVGTLDYDEDSRTISWIISDLSLEQNSVSTSFDISITPTGGDIGSYMRLLSETLITATDSTTGAQMNRSVIALTTDIDDEGAESKGVVME